MKQTILNHATATLPALLVLAGTASAQGTTIDVEATTTGGAAVVQVLPGDLVEYEVRAALAGAPSQGLAMFAFDLGFDGGALAQADTPTSGPLLEFVAPRGINNPAGFGGTPVGGDLVQVGGAMNTIDNMFAPTPTGAVVTGLASGGQDVLATGVLTAPATPGTYTLEVSNVVANALVEQTPGGWWRVRGVEAASTTSLVVEVLDCGVTTYCSGIVNSAGCEATISGSGIASLSGQSAATLTLNDALNDQFGLFVWSRGEAATPLYNGTLCVDQPLVRLLEPGLSGGTGPFGTTCTGSFTRTIDAAFLMSNGFAVGDSVYCQWLYRDPFEANGIRSAFSDAARVTVCP